VSLLERLQHRIAAAEHADPALGQALRADLEVIETYARDPGTLRALEILSAHLELLERLERTAGRAHRTDEEIVAAFRQHGGIRAAARVLHLNPSTVSRRLKCCMQQQPNCGDSTPPAS
jgi:hypothetical protein